MRSGDPSEHVHGGVQDEPIEDGSLDGSIDRGGEPGAGSGHGESPEAQKKRGILEQVAADTGGSPQEDVTRMLAQRFDEAGIAVEPGELEELARSLPGVEWRRAAPAMTEPEKVTDPDKLTPDSPS